jgi:serine/threonine protein kinase
MALTLDEVSLESLFKFQPILDLTEKNFLIKDRYRVLKLYFETTRTNIFLAVDTELKKKVFVHVAKNQFFQRGKELKAWVASIKKMESLPGQRHRFHALEMNLWKNKFFVVTDFFEGIPLFHLLHARKELPLGFVLKILIHLCETLEDACQKKVSSRLISREDFFVDREGALRILRFLPPRMKVDDNETLDSSAADVFYVGCMLYELLSLERAFKKGRTEDELERAHFLAILKIRKNQTQKDNFEQICELFIRATTRRAENRIESLGEFHQSLVELHSWIQQVQENLDQEQDQEQLNSAFDVVFALRGGSVPEEVEDKSREAEAPKKYSRIWGEFDLAEASRWEPDRIFRWGALTMIIAAFAYKFLT